jgi:hypothetical protein
VAAQSPEAELRRVTKRIAELHTRQMEIIAKMELATGEQEVLVSSLKLAADIYAFLDLSQEITTARQRKAVALSRNVERANKRLDKLPESAPREAAQEGVQAAFQRLLKEIFAAKQD